MVEPLSYADDDSAKYYSLQLQRATRVRVWCRQRAFFLRDRIAKIDEWQREESVRRFAVTGGLPLPDHDLPVFVVGKSATLRRLDREAEHVQCCGRRHFADYR